MRPAYVTQKVDRAEGHSFGKFSAVKTIKQGFILHVIKAIVEMGKNETCRCDNQGNEKFRFP
jgi:hypothetical protein